MTRPADIPRIDTERLRLRAPEAGDAPSYAAFYTDAAASEFYGGPLLPHQAYGKLCQDLGHWQLKGYGVWILTRRDTGDVVGTAGFTWPDGWPRHEMTWWLLPAARGQGFAVEASRALIAWAYDNTDWDRVETHMKDANTPALRLVERLGGRKFDRIPFPDGHDRTLWELPRPGGAA